jgi:hypothetical protein
VLILRDVLEWRAAEVADLLDMTTTAVNSALQRARAQMPLLPDDVAEPFEPQRRALLERYAPTGLGTPTASAPFGAAPAYDCGRFWHCPGAVRG